MPSTLKPQPSNPPANALHRSSLQSQATIISNNLVSVSEHLSDHRDLLSSLVAYPGPDYPGRTQANILQQLLRTKLDPRVDDWVARGRAAGTESTIPSAIDPSNPASVPAPSAIAAAVPDFKPLSDAELAELWDWAPVEANQEARKRNWGGNFTLEEREGGIENVVTGLKRQLEDDEGDEDDEEDEEEGDGEDEMEIVGVHRRSGAGSGLEFDVAMHPHHAAEPVVPLPEILRYMTTGRMS